MANPHYFVTIDAETEVIGEAVDVLSAIREQVENEVGCRIPMVWFVRFQRNWSDSVRNESLEFFNSPINPQRSFDGYALAKEQLLRMQGRGDEIAWHYHAYNYVHRDDLDHELKLAILRADMQACAAALRQLHPEFSPRSLRFGWFFIPDYTIFSTLAEAGFDIDASIRRDCTGNVRSFPTCYLPPLTEEIARIDETWFFPFRNTLFLHDSNVVAHQFSWHEQSEEQAAERRTRFKRELLQLAIKSQASGASCSTYQDYVAAAKTAQPQPAALTVE